MAGLVRQYLTQDLNDDEKKTYINYIKGDKNSTDWIEKSIIRREPLLLLELQCITFIDNEVQCGEWVNINEYGVCKCNAGHLCYNVVLPIIKNLIK